MAWSDLPRRSLGDPTRGVTPAGATEKMNYMTPDATCLHLLVGSWLLAATPLWAAEPDKAGKVEPIRLGIITEKDGPHLDIYLKSVAFCQGVTAVAIADADGAEFERARRGLSEHPCLLYTSPSPRD